MDGVWNDGLVFTVVANRQLSQCATHTLLRLPLRCTYRASHLNEILILIMKLASCNLINSEMFQLTLVETNQILLNCKNISSRQRFFKFHLVQSSSDINISSWPFTSNEDAWRQATIAM